MGAACIASAVLGSIMIGVIFLSHYVKINPDNVATPIAAALGDLVTLGLLSLLAQGIYNIGSMSLQSPYLLLCSPLATCRTYTVYVCYGMSRMML